MNQQPLSIAKNAPLKKFRAGNTTATIWLNEGKNGLPPMMSIALERSFKDKNGEWQHTSSFNLNDLPKVALVSMSAYEYLILKGDGLE